MLSEGDRVSGPYLDLSDESQGQDLAGADADRDFDMQLFKKNNKQLF